MMKFIKKYALIPLIFLFLAILPVMSADTSSFKVYLKTNQLTYRVGNPCNIYIAVKNITTSNAEFNIYDALYTSFQPIVYTMIGQEAQTKVDYRLKDIPLENVVAQSSSRKIVLAPGEVFQVEVNLNNLYELEAGEKYKIRALFLPDAIKRDVVVTKNTLYLKIEEAVLPHQQNEDIYKNKGFTPSEIIGLFLNAELAKNWSNYIKYVDREQYISAFPNYARRYNTGTEAEKREVLREFTSYLSSPREDYILDFKVLNQLYMNDGKNALVNVRVRRAGGGSPFVYTYKYKLESYKNYWLVTDVQASVTREVSND